MDAVDLAELYKQIEVFAERKGRNKHQIYSKMMTPEARFAHQLLEKEQGSTHNLFANTLSAFDPDVKKNIMRETLTVFVPLFKKHIKVVPSKYRMSCRKIIEDMADDYEMTKDYLLNVALIEFAHSKGYLALPNKKTPEYSLEDELLAKTSKKKDIPKPPSPPKPPVPPVSGHSSKPQLFLEANDEMYPVDSSLEFIIGRGSSADFRITNNPSVSRKHAKIFEKNGKYYIKDMGSTNGFEFEGNKYDIRQISSGETYSICDVPFTFKFI